MEDKELWYSNSKILSYNKILNFVIGVRGGGKTYENKRWCIADFIKTGNQFFWIRRYKSEITKKFIRRFTSDIQHLFPKDEIDIRGNQTGYEVYINKKIGGFIYPLSTSQSIKSDSFPLVNKIIYDEFLIDEGVIRFLPNEVETFLNLMDTIVRNKENARAICIGNNISSINPYFEYFNIKPNPKKRINKYESIMVEYYQNSNFSDMREKTSFGKLIKNTNYGEFSLYNKSLNDDESFVGKTSPKAKYQMTIVYNGKEFNIWADYDDCMFYVNYKKDPFAKNRTFSITTSDHKPNMLLLQGFKKYPTVRGLVQCFQMGRLTFIDINAKYNFLEFYPLLK